MGSKDYYSSGDWNASCGQCSRKGKASEMVKNWQGLWMHPEHNETRQPQDFVRAVPDIQTPPWVLPPSDEFVGICFPNNMSGIAGYGVAYCMIANYLSPFFDPNITEN